MAEDNGLYMSMARLVRSWSTRPRPRCTTNCYCLIYCNLLVMSSILAHFCDPWLTYKMNRSNGAKKHCDSSLLMRLSGCTFSINNFSLCFLSSSKNSTIGPHIPLPCIVGQSHGQRGNYLPLISLKQHYAKHRFLQIPLPNDTIADSFFQRCRCIFLYLNLWVM